MMNILTGLAVFAAIAVPVALLYSLTKIGADPKEHKSTLEEMYPDAHLFI
jgi:hypothetical protein